MFPETCKEPRNGSHHIASNAVSSSRTSRHLKNLRCLQRMSGLSSTNRNILHESKGWEPSQIVQPLFAFSSSTAVPDKKASAEVSVDKWLFLTWHCWTVLVCSSLLPPLRGAVASLGLPWSRLIHHDLLPLWQFLHNDRNEQVHMILSGLLMVPIHVYFLLEYRKGSQFPHIGCFCRNFQQSIHMGIYQSLFLT